MLRNRIIGFFGVLIAIMMIATACSSDDDGEAAAATPPPGDIPVACWAAAADGSYDDFEGSVALFDECTTDDYSFGVVNPALGEIVCFRDGGFCPLEQPNLSRPAVRLSGFAAGAARGEIGSRHQISNVVVSDADDSSATVTFRSTAYYFNEDGSFEIGWGDHELEVINDEGTWKILNEDVFIPNPNERIVAVEPG